MPDDAAGALCLCLDLDPKPPADASGSLAGLAGLAGLRAAGVKSTSKLVWKGSEVGAEDSALWAVKAGKRLSDVTGAAGAAAGALCLTDPLPLVVGREVLSLEPELLLPLLGGCLLGMAGKEENLAPGSSSISGSL